MATRTLAPGATIAKRATFTYTHQMPSARTVPGFHYYSDRLLGVCSVQDDLRIAD
jgi:hypothetical protein